MKPLLSIKNRWLDDGTAIWLEKLVDKTILRYIESNYPMNRPEEVELFQPILGKLLYEVIRQRYGKETTDTNFLPLNILEKGTQCAAPVCLLCRNYTSEDAEELLEWFESSEYRITELKSRFSTVLNFRQALKQIVGRGVRDKEEAFWNQWDYESSIQENFEKNPELRQGLKERIENQELPLGSGFLVGKDHLLTNHHVLDRQPLEKVTVYFRYEDRDLLGQQLPVVPYKIDLTWSGIGNSNLDYRLVKLRLSNNESDLELQKKYQLTFLEAGNNFGWLKLSPDPNLVAPPIPSLKWHNLARFLPEIEQIPQFILERIFGDSDAYSLWVGAQLAKKILMDSEFRSLITNDKEINPKLEVTGLLGEPVNIIQHPKGRQKEIVIYNNRVQMISEDFIQYETDTEPGSSGSPIFNARWQLVGIHHSGLLNFRTGNIVGCLGTRTCRIVEDLRHQRDHLLSTQTEASQEFEQLNDFIHQYIDNSIRGTIFISAGRKREIDSILKPDASDFEAKYLHKLGEKIVEQIDQTAFKPVHIQQQNWECDRLTEVVQWIQDYEKENEEYKRGDVGIEIRLDIAEPPRKMPELTDKKSPEEVAESIRGAKVAYYAKSAERSLNAEILLQTVVSRVQAEIPETQQFQNRGTIPTLTDLPQNVAIPSLVLYVGYLTNAADRELLTDEQKLEKVAKAIAEALMNWSSSLSPS
jgi:Trypsin-like peptidase domain/N-acetylmuramoyl-L-alanine amidase